MAAWCGPFAKGEVHSTLAAKCANLTGIFDTTVTGVVGEFRLGPITMNRFFRSATPIGQVGVGELLP